jgi:multiple antibiotic resistance protein
MAALPILAGPGSIAVTVGFTSLAKGWLHYTAIIAGIVAVVGLTYVVLRLSSRGVRSIGPVGVHP